MNVNGDNPREPTRILRDFTTMDSTAIDGLLQNRYRGCVVQFSEPVYALTIGPLSSLSAYILVPSGISPDTANNGPIDLANNPRAVVFGVKRPWIGYLPPGQYYLAPFRPLPFGILEGTWKGDRTSAAQDSWSTDLRPNAVIDALAFHDLVSAQASLSLGRLDANRNIYIDTSVLGWKAADWADNASITHYFVTQGRRRADFVFRDTGASTTMTLAVYGGTCIDACYLLLANEKLLWSTTAAVNVDVQLTDTGEYDYYKIVMTRLTLTNIFSARFSARDD